MYSYEEKLKTIELYIQYDHRAKQVIRESGYPSTQALSQ